MADERAASLRAERLDLFYGDFQALKQVSVRIAANRLTSLIGPSGCGKSTLLRVFNRMNDVVPGCRIRGSVEVAGESIYAAGVDPSALRRRVGMVFQRPNPFPFSVFENVVYGPRIHGSARGDELSAICTACLKAVGLWEELREKLEESALELSLEQMQRLCIARALALQPQVLLMDEPCSALDPVATLRVETLMRELSRSYTVLVVTHNMQQAARISDDTGFMLLGELIEFGPTKSLFTHPRDSRTEDYVTGRYG
ncbi:MAG TPA: phosphate ABC transporter ATP-binding protein PstB [Polyangiaceae bacterium]|nr:phosphate ABC transporter ATP-binding protein PstB [Polyangiaceae bacterium]